MGEYEISDCPGLDTTYYDCFRITSELTSTMLGSGVEYGQKVISYLAKNQGVIKEEVFVRWTENPYFPEFNPTSPDSNGHSWVGLSRIELSTFKETQSGGLFRQLTQPVSQLDLDEFETIPEFNYDPFLPSHPAGIQTIELGNE
jgi:hypothetical protein